MVRPSSGEQKKNVVYNPELIRPWGIYLASETICTMSAVLEKADGHIYTKRIGCKLVLVDSTRLPLKPRMSSSCDANDAHACVNASILSLSQPTSSLVATPRLRQACPWRPVLSL